MISFHEDPDGERVLDNPGEPGLVIKLDIDIFDATVGNFYVLLGSEVIYGIADLAQELEDKKIDEDPCFMIQNDLKSLVGDLVDEAETETLVGWRDQFAEALRRIDEALQERKGRSA